ncbi:hypothetical protein QBZ16_005082 [Prototheca wickerhamii]|uniref:Uncharacterized protein n=1 Tax=Prototheca wickerhamii TaxID=3111 RepID=A0AAD9IGN3_PROWI|nr:hypothetical protein QBZ16_005082 [Prototheca wickerhamii]
MVTSSVRSACAIGRWFFLAALIIQAVGMLIAAYLYVTRPPSQDEYTEFEDDAERGPQRAGSRSVQMQQQQTKGGAGLPPNRSAAGAGEAQYWR